MQKSFEILNFKLPVINQNNNISKIIKENNKTNIQKINGKNTYKLKRNSDITNNLNSLSRNGYKSKDIIKQKRLSINSQEKNNSEKINNNETPIKDSCINNNDIINNLSKNRITIPFNDLDSDKKDNNILKIPNSIYTTKNSYYLNLYPKNGFANNIIKNSNFSLYKDKNIRYNSISVISGKKSNISNKSYNKEIVKIKEKTQNNIKILYSENAKKKSNKINLECFLRNQGQNFRNIKYQLLMPKIMNSTMNSKKYKIYYHNEDNKDNKIPKKLIDDKYFISQQNFLKEIRNIENINLVNNFIQILKQYILIEVEFDNFLTKGQNEQNMINSATNIIQLYNNFFNQLDNITLEINIFINKEYNSLLQKILKLLIYYHCFLFIHMVLFDSKNSFINIKAKYCSIFKKISFCLYNIFTKFIYKELSNNKYKDLDFISSLNSLFNNNGDYIISSHLSNNDIYKLISKNYDLSVELFIKTLNNNDIKFLEEVSLSLKNILLNLNKNDLIYHIDICLNTFLYTILEKNISKAKFNSEKNNLSQNNKSLNHVPYLPPLSHESKQKYKYTIVIDIDETLGHFIQNEIKTKYFMNYGYIIDDNTNKILFKLNNKDKIKVGMFLVRPYAKYFLEKLNNLFFEIVIFSAGTKEYCDKVLDILDINNNIIKYRLYRTHLSLRNINNDVKDLSLLGRDLSKVIMIDNFSENYKLQQDNGLPINSWVGDANDTSLRDLIPIMEYIVENDINDVRSVVRKVKMQLNNFSENNFYYDKVNLKG